MAAAALAALPTILEICAAGAAAVGLLDIVNNKVEEINSNAPGARYKALQAAKEEEKKAHEQGMEDMKKLWNDRDAANRAAEAAASRRIREEREANNKVIEEMKLGIRAEEAKRDAQMREREQEHERKMATLRADTKESRDAAEKEHAKKVEEIEKKHEVEKKEAQRRLDLAKEEGDEKVKQAESERDAVMKMRKEELELFTEKTKELMEAHQTCLTGIRKKTNELRIANEKEGRLQIEEQSRLKMRHLEECAMSLAATFTLDASQKIVKKFLEVIQPGIDANTSLQTIRLQCLENGSDIEPGMLTPYFDKLKQVKDTFQHNFVSYNIFLGNYHRADPQLEDKCGDFIKKLKKVMESDDMAIIILNFQSAIDAKKQDKIERYCGISKSLCDKLGEDPQAEIQSLLQQVIRSHTENAIQNPNLRQLE